MNFAPCRRIVSTGVRGTALALLAGTALVAGLPRGVQAKDGSPEPIAAAEEAGGGWHNDLTTAQTLAARTGRPLFVVFRCER